MQVYQIAHPGSSVAQSSLFCDEMDLVMTRGGGAVYIPSADRGRALVD